MAFHIPEMLKHLWELWEIRAFILFSLFLQCFLILASPLRKRVAKIWLYMAIWSAYLLADWVASFTVGLISSSQGDKSCNKTDINPDIFAFWASFLLVHLGGPDTITAFALEDNELWRRHMVTLIFQFVSAMYVFYQSMPRNALWIPTLFMFISGIIKYAERTYSLYCASVDTFRDKILRKPDPGPNYAKLMKEYSAMKEANLPTSIKMFEQPDQEKSVDRVKVGALEETEIVLKAYELFETFKGIIVDIILSARERDVSQKFFRERTAKDAFDVIEVELNFMYDVLFTKLPVVFTTCNYVIRFFCWSLAITSLGFFYFERKANFKAVDVIITYTLLLGAISMDVLAFVYLICSDWLKVFIYELPPVNIELEENKKSGEESASKETGRTTKWLKRRWSESVASYNLIHYTLNRRPKFWEKIYDSLGLITFLNGIKYVERREVTGKLNEHIFEQLKNKSEVANDLETAKELSAAKGDWALQEEGCGDLLQYVLQVDYDQSLLLWHIATELCLQDDDDDDDDTKYDRENYRDICKVLSDYMLYLLIMQPTMMSAVAGIGQLRFKDTCEEAQKYFREISISNEMRKKKARVIQKLGSYMKQWLYKNIKGCLPSIHKKIKEEEDKNHKEHCKKLLDVPTEVKPGTVKGEKSKSVLFDACILAKELRKKKGKKWWVMSRVWVEMLSYAAINCRATTHAQQLPRGGELLTLVWLLMVQFGLGSQFQIDVGHARAKLTVGK